MSLNSVKVLVSRQFPKEWFEINITNVNNIGKNLLHVVT